MLDRRVYIGEIILNAELRLDLLMLIYALDLTRTHIWIIRCANPQRIEIFEQTLMQICE